MADEEDDAVCTFSAVDLVEIDLKGVPLPETPDEPGKPAAYRRYTTKIGDDFHAWLKENKIQPFQCGMAGLGREVKLFLLKDAVRIIKWLESQGVRLVPKT